MLIKKAYLGFVPFALITTSVLAVTKPEISGKFTEEIAGYVLNGTTTDTTAHDTTTFKAESSLRVYVDGDLEDDKGSTYHMELQGFKDTRAIGDHGGTDSYTQRDPLREAYIDTTHGDWAIRAGKQQVVWGTADGAKLLDIINPTDYSEMAQNQMEDSRIPVWMINGEKIQDDGSSVQVIVSQPRENVFAGLDRNISQAVRSASSIKGHNVGHPFLLKGVDSITGKKNGFLNITPEIGALAQGFYNTFSATVADGGLGSTTALGASSVTVGSFASTTGASSGGYGTTITNYSNSTSGGLAGDGTGTNVLNAFIGGYGYSTNLLSANTGATFAGVTSGGVGADTDSAFEYMKNTKFGSFDTLASAQSQYKYKMPDNDVDLSLRYKNTLSNGLNYSTNYSYAYAKDPIINLSWRYANGTVLTKTIGDGTSTVCSEVSMADKIYLNDGSNCLNATNLGAGTTSKPILTFEQTVKRSHNIGGSFDYGLDTAMFGPVVVRGEAVYQQGVYSPVINLASLSIGDLTDALTMVEGDRLKYVIGADFTADTNMMVSFQFIQDRNLDFVDTTSTTTGGSSGLKYTTDYATMHLTNGFNKASANKNFYSMFLSKPFGESGQHRWNNITMIEETGGRWNRADVEITLDDNTVFTTELNSYWGDKNTQFGQLEDSSNIQMGFKYSF